MKFNIIPIIVEQFKATIHYIKYKHILIEKISKLKKKERKNIKLLIKEIQAGF